MLREWRTSSMGLATPSQPGVTTVFVYRNSGRREVPEGVPGSFLRLAGAVGRMVADGYVVAVKYVAPDPLENCDPGVGFARSRGGGGRVQIAREHVQ